MKVLVGVFSPAAAWILPGFWIERLRRDFPQHQFIDVWSEADCAGCCREVRRRVHALHRSRPGRIAHEACAGCRPRPPASAAMLSPELIASPIVLTSARGIRARAIAEHVLGVTPRAGAPAAHRAAAAGRTGLGSRRARAAAAGPNAARTADGHRRARLDRPRGRSARRALRAAGVGDPQAARSSRSRRRRRGCPARTGSRNCSRTATSWCWRRRLTPDTRALIDRDTLAACKRGALLINIGRGKLIDDEAVDRGARGRHARRRGARRLHDRAAAIRPARTGTCRTSSSRRTCPGRWRTTGRRSSRCSPTICGVSRRAAAAESSSTTAPGLLTHRHDFERRDGA